MSESHKTSRIVPTRAEFPYMQPMQVRWGDFDILGHVNNVQYIRYFEYMVVRFVGQECGVGWAEGPCVPFAAENGCRFIRPVECGALGPVDITLDCGLRIQKIGTSSVVYDLAVFEPGRDDAAAAGWWVHVYVDRETQRPVRIPAEARAAYEKFMIP